MLRKRREDARQTAALDRLRHLQVCLNSLLYLLPDEAGDHDPDEDRHEAEREDRHHGGRADERVALDRRGRLRQDCIDVEALGRYANRIANATFTLDGVTYNLTKNNGEHTLHSGKKGFGYIVWDVEEAAADKLVLSCLSEDGTDGFPGSVKTFLTYSITEDNSIKLNFEATTDKATVVNMSHHVYFNLDGFEDGNLLDFVLTVDADNVTEADSTNIPTGTLIPVEGTVYDFREGVRLGERQFAMPAVLPEPGTPMPEIPEGMVLSYDINFCLNHTEPGKFEKVASLYAPKSGRYMEVFNNQPGMQIYTGRKTAIAMESQRYPDSPNHPDFPSSVLRPGETYVHTIEYRFSIK